MNSCEFMPYPATTFVPPVSPGFTAVIPVKIQLRSASY